MKARASILAFGIYLAAASAILIIVPDKVADLAKLQLNSPILVRLVGLLVMICSAYYIYAAVKDIRQLYSFTVITRLSALPVLALVALAEKGGWALLLFWVPDGIGAVWTIAALILDRRQNGG